MRKNVILLPAIIFVILAACVSKADKQHKDVTMNKTPQNSDSLQKKVSYDSVIIGYNSLPVFLGDKKSDIENKISLKWDKDNDDATNLISYYTPLITTRIAKLNCNIDLNWEFLKKDSSLKLFSASVVFDNAIRNKILPHLIEDLQNQFPYIKNFTTEELKSSSQLTKNFKDFKVSIILDTVAYSPGLKYTIEGL